jgi:predicted PurR-regulated permease PerM
VAEPTAIPLVEEKRERERRLDGVILGFGAIAIIALAYYVRTIVNPFVGLVVLYIVLYPVREYRAARRLLWAGVTLFGIWFIYTLSGLLVPFILGAVLAYLFNPLVTKLHETRRIHRTWSSLILVLLFCAVLVGIGWIVIPSLVSQTKEFISRLSFFAKEHSNTFDQAHIRRILLNIGLPKSVVDEVILVQIGPQLRKSVSIVPHIVFVIIAGLPKFLERTLNLIIVPVAMFYFLKDWPKLVPLFNDLVPAKDPKRRAAIFADVDRIVYGYVRGQATVALIVGVLGAIAYSILGIPYAGLLGAILAVTDLVPIVGMIFSMFVVELVIVLTMVLNFGVLASGVLVIIGLHFLEVYFISPRIIGTGIGLPPILMILALMIFGYFMGFLGLLIAVPTTGVIVLFVNEYRNHSRNGHSS